MEAEWDPPQYLRFDTERRQPAVDLMARVPGRAFRWVVDLGCGPGSITQMLADRYADADVLGIDASSAMLATAAANAPRCRFLQADIAPWQPARPLQLIFSNAALHWLPDHRALLPRLFGFLAPRGWLAVQMPAMHDAPFRRLQAEVAGSAAWRDRLSGIASAPPILDPSAYWDLLASVTSVFDVWETVYWHALTGDDAVAEWAAGSSLRPFLGRLTLDEGRRFMADYADALRPRYPKRPDGRTLLPFRRLFLLAQAPSSQ